MVCEEKQKVHFRIRVKMKMKCRPTDISGKMQTKKTETIMEESEADDKGDLRKEVYENTHNAIIFDYHWKEKDFSLIC